MKYIVRKQCGPPKWVGQVVFQRGFREGRSRGEFCQVTRVVNSYSLGRIHRIALLDKEWCLGRVSPRSTYLLYITIFWKTRGLLVFVRKPPRSGLRTAFSLSTLGRIFGCKSTFPFPFYARWSWLMRLFWYIVFHLCCCTWSWDVTP